MSIPILRALETKLDVHLGIDSVQPAEETLSRNRQGTRGKQFEWNDMLAREKFQACQDQNSKLTEACSKYFGEYAKWLMSNYEVCIGFTVVPDKCPRISPTPDHPINFCFIQKACVANNPIRVIAPVFIISFRGDKEHLKEEITPNNVNRILEIYFPSAELPDYCAALKP